MTNSIETYENLSDYEKYSANVRIARELVMDTVKPIFQFNEALMNKTELRSIKAKLSIALDSINDAIELM